MKLIYCRKCYDIRRLFENEVTECQCGQSWGRYIDNLNAWIGGEAVPIGFTNSSLAFALANQPLEGKGQEFIAFVIPEVCPTITRKTK